ncbi:MAG: sirohydrochlorin chelatase [Gammaproteobacteria bacterium]|nr:sirohydrochlorin chelatase [Gammaproteobacteria bacterium]MBU1654231.1 sirohydrochlorin chelatase [Gammaproteobacteria bacterium]MBU1961981.1 sirohydrochlorin chelatase [Gammaproteobacteria bacterium]
MKDTTLLLVGHGSRNAEGNRQTLDCAARWRERRPERRIEACFIEHAEPSLDEGLDRAARDARRVRVLPLILNAAGHVKMELPEALERARGQHPAVEFQLLPHLGMGREVFSLLQAQLDRLMRSLAMPDPRTTGVILLGRGTSDAGANGELAKMARWLYEANDHELVEIAFTGVTWPRLETLVQRQALLGMTQICVLPVYLFTGVLIERIESQLDRLRRQYPRIAFGLGSPFGLDPLILDLLDERAAGAERGSLLECDGCKYREAAESGHSHPH